MNKYLVDTTVLVDMLRGDKEAKVFLETKPMVSVVSVAELIQGSKNKEQQNVIDKMCRLFPVVQIDQAISQKTIKLLQEYYLSHGLLFLDALIAATAIIRKKVLVTANIKDFKFIKELEVVTGV